MITPQDSSVDKDVKRELHDSGRSSPCEDHSSSNGQIIELKLQQNSSGDPHRQRSAGNEQRKVIKSNTHRSSIKGVSIGEGKASTNREAERRAAVLERRRKQEEELKAKMEQLRIRQENRLNRAAATMQLNPALRRAQLLSKPKSGFNLDSKRPRFAHYMLPTESARAHSVVCTHGVARCPRAPGHCSNSDDFCPSQTVYSTTVTVELAVNSLTPPKANSKSLPARIQQAVERLSIPKYRREEQNTPLQRMAQSMTSTAISSNARSAKQPASRRDMSRSFNKELKVRAKSEMSKQRRTSEKDTEETEYKRKLEEKRRMAREKQEQERNRLEEARLKREEEEHQAQLERLRLQEEMIKSEQESLRMALEEKEKADLAQKEIEEKKQQKNAEQEREQMEEAKRLEEERQARLKQEEEERQKRKKKVNDILSSHRSQVVTSDRQTLLSSATESVNIFFNNELISNTTSQVLQTYFNRPRNSETTVPAGQSDDLSAGSEEQLCLTNGKEKPDDNTNN